MASHCKSARSTDSLNGARPGRQPHPAGKDASNVLTLLDACREPARAVDPRGMAESPDSVSLPVFSHGVSAGFPSPADDYVEDVIDLNRHLIVQGHEASTFILRVEGWSMIGAGIHDGDEVVVDRALEAGQGDIVVAVVNGELTIKRLGKVDGHIALLPDNPHFKPVLLNDGETMEVWGVVTRCLRNLRRP